jgi:hypothetical protein
MSAANTGLHVNASVPGLSRETGLIALVDPLKRSTPARRRDLFNDPLFSAVMAAISNDADGEDEVAEAFLDRMMWERGLHAMNPIPLMRGHGYVEFRHLDSNSLVRDLEGTIDIVHDLVDLLARPPMDAARARLAKAVAIVRRIRDLDASCRIPAAVAALDVEDLCDRHDREGELLNLVASICESEPVLARTFQWIAKARHLDSQPATRRAFLALSRLPLQAQHLIHAMETRRLAEKGMSSRVRLGSRLPIPTNAARRMPVA